MALALLDNKPNLAGEFLVSSPDRPQPQGRIILKSRKTKSPEIKTASANVYTKHQHNISNGKISPKALQVLQHLQDAGYQAYLVGGCVRDLLLGRLPKDFDVATDATPEQVRQLFRNSRIIGRRFRLVHVYFSGEIIEVATFRSVSQQTTVHANGRLLRDNVFGTVAEDAVRRDFTVNALYYNPKDDTVLDYTGGMTDHQNGILRLIGDPCKRYTEDPVRMLRALRFSAKLGFTLETNCEQALLTCNATLHNVPNARLYDECLKLFLSGQSLATFKLLSKYGFFAILFPQTQRYLDQDPSGFGTKFIVQATSNSDQRIAGGKTVTPYFFLSVFLWQAVKIASANQQKIINNKSVALQKAIGEVIGQQCKSLSIPKRTSQAMREVWLLQASFTRQVGNKPWLMLNLPRFRAAYDFLLLRAATGDADPALADWWTKFQQADGATRKKMTTRPQKTTKNPSKNPPSNNHKTAKQVEVYIGLGSNLHNPKKQIAQARIALSLQTELVELAFSSLYRSPPLAGFDQPDYINAVLKIRTSLAAEQLLQILQTIETEQGRIRTDERWSARTLDLDILLYGSEIINNATLQVPHPGIGDRAFVLHPVAEIAPSDLAIPLRGTLAELLAACPLQNLEKL